MSVNVKKSKETQYKKYTVFKMDFQSKKSYFLLNCIDRTLAPFYIDKDKYCSVKEKNMTTRLDEKNI